MTTGSQSPVKTVIAAIICCIYTQVSEAQVGIGTTTPDASAQLDIVSAEKGILIPRVTLENRPGSPGKAVPAEGLLVYQTDNDPGFYYYDGSKWEKVGKNSDRPSTSFARSGQGVAGWTPQVISGNSTPVALNFRSISLSGYLTANAAQDATSFTVQQTGLYRVSYLIYLGGGTSNSFSYLLPSDESISNLVYQASLDYVLNNFVLKGEATLELSAGTSLQLMMVKQSSTDITVQWNNLTVTKL